LALFALGGFVDEIFKGLVHHVEVGIEELPLLQRADADLQVLRGEADLFIGGEDAFPFLLGLIKEVLQGFLRLRGGVDVAKAQVAAVLGVVRVLPMPDDEGDAVTPRGQRCTGGVDGGFFNR
jgi:hypothetical protein